MSTACKLQHLTCWRWNPTLIQMSLFFGCFGTVSNAKKKSEDIADSYCFSVISFWTANFFQYFFFFHQVPQCQAWKDNGSAAFSSIQTPIFVKDGPGQTSSRCVWNSTSIIPQLFVFIYLLHLKKLKSSKQIQQLLQGNLAITNSTWKVISKPYSSLLLAGNLVHFSSVLF
jgi:hypothetical protein